MPTSNTLNNVFHEIYRSREEGEWRKRKKEEMQKRKRNNILRSASKSKFESNSLMRLFSNISMSCCLNDQINHFFSFLYFPLFLILFFLYFSLFCFSFLYFGWCRMWQTKIKQNLRNVGFPMQVLLIITQQWQLYTIRCSNNFDMSHNNIQLEIIWTFLCFPLLKVKTFLIMTKKKKRKVNYVPNKIELHKSSNLNLWQFKCLCYHILFFGEDKKQN